MKTAFKTLMMNYFPSHFKYGVTSTLVFNNSDIVGQNLFYLYLTSGVALEGVPQMHTPSCFVAETGHLTVWAAGTTAIFLKYLCPLKISQSAPELTVQEVGYLRWMRYDLNFS